MRIDVELTDDQYCLLSFEIGFRVGQLRRAADEVPLESSEHKRLFDGANQLTIIFQLIQEGSKP